MPRQILSKRSGGPKGASLPNKSPKLESGHGDDHSEDLGSDDEAEKVIAISSGDDAEIEAGSDGADMVGDDDEDDEDGDFEPGAEEEDMEPLLFSPEDAPLLKIGDPAQEIDTLLRNRAEEERKSLVSLVTVLVAELDDAINRTNSPPKLLGRDIDDEDKGSDEDEDHDDDDDEKEDEPDVDPASFLEMIDDITFAPPEIAWKLAAKAAFFLPRPYLAMSAAALETVLFSWKAQQQRRWSALTGEQRQFLRKTIFSRARTELGMFVRAAVATEAAQSNGGGSETLLALVSLLQEEKAQTTPPAEDAISDDADDEGVEGLWRFVVPLLSQPIGYGTRDMPVSGAWHRADIGSLLDPIAAKGLWDAAQRRLREDEELLRLPVWMAMITKLPLIAQQLSSVKPDDVLGLKIEQWSGLDPNAIADLTAAVLRSPPLRAYHRGVLLEGISTTLGNHKGFAHLDGSAEPTEEDVAGLLNLLQSFAGAGSVLTYAGRFEPQAASQLLSADFARSVLVPRLVDLLAHSNIAGVFADRKLILLDPADLVLLLRTVRALVTSTACVATLEQLLDANRTFNTRAPVLAAIFVAFASAPLHAPADLLKSIEELVSRNAILLNMLEDEQLKLALLKAALRSPRRAKLDTVLGSVTDFYLKLKYLGNPPSLPRVALATDLALPGRRDMTRVRANDDDAPPILELFAEPPPARICYDVARIAWARSVQWTPASHWRNAPAVQRALFTISLVRTRIPALWQLPREVFHTLLEHCAALHTRAQTWEEHAKTLYPDHLDRIDTFLQLATAPNIRRSLVVRLSLCEDSTAFQTAQRIPPKPKVAPNLKGGPKRRGAIRRP